MNDVNEKENKRYENIQVYVDLHPSIMPHCLFKGVRTWRSPPPPPRPQHNSSFHLHQRHCICRQCAPLYFPPFVCAVFVCAIISHYEFSKQKTLQAARPGVKFLIKSDTSGWPQKLLHATFYFRPNTIREKGMPTTGTQFLFKHEVPTPFELITISIKTKCIHLNLFRITR